MRFCSVLLVAAVVHADVHVSVYNNTAFGWPSIVNRTLPSLANIPNLLTPFTSAVVQGQLYPTSTPTTWGLFEVVIDAGHVRLWVDDHLLVDGGPAVAPPLQCPYPGGDPSQLPGYFQWLGTQMPINGTGDPRSMTSLGGDCTKGCSREVCSQLCVELAQHGCVGFVTHQHQFDFCSMRRLAPGLPSSEWKSLLVATSLPFTSYTVQSATVPTDPKWCPPTTSPAPPGTNGTAAYAIPIPFLPGLAYAKFRLEITTGATVPHVLGLKMNNSHFPDSRMTSNVAEAELRYQEERAGAEVGWNTWYSRDMLSHTLLPSAATVSLSLHVGNATTAHLGGQGPSCSAAIFPAKHGYHDVRGQYTEIEQVSVGITGASFKVESATTSEGDLYIIVTTLTLPISEESDPTPSLSVTLNVPIDYLPRFCNITRQKSWQKRFFEPVSDVLQADCPGFPKVFVSASSMSTTLSNHEPTTPGVDPGTLEVSLPSTVGGTVEISATTRRGPARARDTPGEVVANARSALLARYAKFGEQNETYAGAENAISWNVIYTPYEGIITPVFRGASWSATRPHAYVLFEWDTYLSTLISSVTDTWVARSNIIAMTKSLSFKGYVPGFWNGLCGEVDKSKPPVGGLALSFHLARHPEDLWVAELLFDQFLLWNRWWAEARQYGFGNATHAGSKVDSNGVIAPGCTRENQLLSISCGTSPISNRVDTVTGETGLDNSPLYDDAMFVVDEDVIDYVDVGMTSLYARDCVALAAVAGMIGRDDYRNELERRGSATSNGLRSMWNGEAGIHVNKRWTNGTFGPVDPKNGRLVVGPPNLYPLLARAYDTDDQVKSVLERYLTNSSELGVNSGQHYGIPSISRSSSAANDNNYWRGRAWGPMNLLIYIGLGEYAHIPEVKSVMSDLATQSESTFLLEWTENHRVMENYNSQSGLGCDSGDAVPFYHWGALNALVQLMEKQWV